MSDRASVCLKCHESQGAIRDGGLSCWDGYNEMGQHQFVHRAIVRQRRAGEALWYAFCECGWNAFEGANFPTREDARIAGREHVAARSKKSSL